jgi:hypothetical protein
MLEAHTSGADVRSALMGLQAAVHEFAEHAGRAAEQAGHGLDTGVLVNAVLALVGRTDSLDALRRSRLAEVPQGGGLDFLAALPASLPLPARPSPSPHPSSYGPAPDAQAAGALADARARSELARGTLRDAESRLRLAEDRLRDAEAEAAAARRAFDRARLEAESAAAQISRLEQAQAERRVE